MIMPEPMLVMVVTVDASKAPPRAASHKGKPNMTKHLPRQGLRGGAGQPGGHTSTPTPQ